MYPMHMLGSKPEISQWTKKVTRTRSGIAKLLESEISRCGYNLTTTTRSGKRENILTWKFALWSVSKESENGKQKDLCDHNYCRSGIVGRIKR